MLKKAVFVVLEVIAYLVVYAVGSILPGAHKLPEWTVSASGGRVFVLDGLVLMALLFGVTVAVQAARKRLRMNWGEPVLALVLALLLLLATHFPLAWITPSRM